jgi:uncharacterized protein (TIGR03000 family)
MSWHSIIRAAPALALAGVLAVASPSYARGGHGGGGHGGFHGGGFHGGGFRGAGFRGGYYGRGFYGRGLYGYRGYRGYGYRRYGYYPYGWGWGLYPYYYGGYGYYPSYYNNYYNYGTYPYYYPTEDYSTGYEAYYPTAVSQQAPNTVRLNVHVPVANAKVWVDNTLTTQTGTNRVFESPALKPGSNYSYVVRAEWTQNGKKVEQTQKVRFHAGEEITVNLTNAVAAQR